MSTYVETFVDYHHVLKVNQVLLREKLDVSLYVIDLLLSLVLITRNIYTAFLFCKKTIVSIDEKDN